MKNEAKIHIRITNAQYAWLTENNIDYPVLVRYLLDKFIMEVGYDRRFDEGNRRPVKGKYKNV